jgi:hypothetical protein
MSYVVLRADGSPPWRRIVPFLPCIMQQALSTGRGIYLAPGTGPGGERYFVAVDAAGRRILSAAVYPGHDTLPIEAALWSLLDRYDPPAPRLRLVRS